MKLNTKEATGIIVRGEDFEFIKAVRKPNSKLKITQEIWFRGKAKMFSRRKER